MDLSWNGIKNNHLLLMVLCCLIPLVLIFGATSFGLNLRNYSWVILLLCPLSMMWMMKDMHGSHAGHGSDGSIVGHDGHGTNGMDEENAYSEAGNDAKASMKNKPPAKKAACH